MRNFYAGEWLLFKGEMDVTSPLGLHSLVVTSFPCPNELSLVSISFDGAPTGSLPRDQNCSQKRKTTYRTTRSKSSSE